MARAPELLVTLDRESRTSLRAQLEGAVRDAIRSGRLAVGDRLPSSRMLAADLGLSRGVVQECYEQLAAEGYLLSRTGSGTTVAAAVTGTAGQQPRFALSTPLDPGRSRMLADFESGVPDLASVPRADWAWAVQEVCRSAPNAAFDYGDPLGVPELRETLAAYLGRVRAVDASAEHVLVCNGMAQGLSLVLRALRPGVVACEDPGAIATARAAASASGSTVVPVPVDDLGLDVAALAATDAHAVIVTPAHQWPTGVVLAPERRHALLAWAGDRDALVLEDDYDAEFRYDRDPVGTLQGLAPDRVVALGTVSKSLAPALRLGWAVVPPRLVDAVAAAKDVADRGTAALDQLALARLIESGRYDRHLRRVRTEYVRRRTALVEALAEHAPGVPLTGLAAGFHAVAHLPDGTDVDALVTEARARGVGLYSMGLNRSERSPEPPRLVFGYGNTPVRAIHAGIAAVADLLADGSGRPGAGHLPGRGVEAVPHVHRGDRDQQG
jgi:GntR family transcriptional regulator/MocR family aminotransferase